MFNLQVFTYFWSCSVSTSITSYPCASTLYWYPVYIAKLSSTLYWYPVYIARLSSTLYWIAV